ncbi:hypothetical protein EDD11_003596 [Mortierella claussenii]|nr:hypothetical protein EDD11_003596 [Mortierella claussenii]
MHLRDTPDEPAKVKAPLSDLEEALEDARVNNGIPGMSVAVLHKGTVIFAKGFGTRNEAKEPFTEETIMPIASVSKSFTAAAIGELVAEGKMDWDKTPVSKYLPEFECGDPVLNDQLTIADMLSHRTNFPEMDLFWYRSRLPRRELIKRLKHAQVQRKMGVTAEYNNIIYAVAGEAAANVAGISYEDLIKIKLLEPLGLKSSGLGVMEMKDRFDNYAMPYEAYSLEGAQKGDFKVGYLDEIYMADAPAGDIHSNVLDLVRYGRVIMQSGKLDGKQVLNEESVKELWTGRTFMQTTRRSSEFAPTLAYGLGWMLDSYKGQIVYRHNGSNPGYRSTLHVYPDIDLVIAMQANVEIASLIDQVPYHVVDELLDLPKTKNWLADEALAVARKAYNSAAEDAKGRLPKRLKNSPATHDLEAFVGEYSDPLHGEVFVELKDDEDNEDEHAQEESEGKNGNNGKKKALFFKLNEAVCKMEHYHFDSFKIQILDFAINEAVLLTFRTSADGKVEGIVVRLNPEEEIYYSKIIAPESKDAQK